jgi:hypothetical protein
MVRRKWWLAGVALALTGSSGCGLFCDRYCERERERYERYNAPARCGCAPAPACAPSCGPVAAPACPPTGYYQPQAGCCPQ